MSAASSALQSRSRGRSNVQSLHEALQCHPSCMGRHRPMTVGRVQIALGEHGGPRKTLVKLVKTPPCWSPLLLNLSRYQYVARLEPRCASLALSVVRYACLRCAVAGGLFSRFVSVDCIFLRQSSYSRVRRPSSRRVCVLLANNPSFYQKRVVV